MNIPVLVELSVPLDDMGGQITGFHVYPSMKSWEAELASTDIIPDDQEVKIYVNNDNYHYTTAGECRSSYKTTLIGHSEAATLRLYFHLKCDTDNPGFWVGYADWRSPSTLLEIAIEDYKENERIAEQENAS